MNLSFAGCGFLGIYHVGVAVCFRKYAPHLLLDKISGASVGALAATCLLCEMPLGKFLLSSNIFLKRGHSQIKHAFKGVRGSDNTAYASYILGWEGEWRS